MGSAAYAAGAVQNAHSIAAASISAIRTMAPVRLASFLASVMVAMSAFRKRSVYYDAIFAIRVQSFTLSRR